jgi:cytosine/adenosine deaminase-related metal-dependent hydrolase
MTSIEYLASIGFLGSDVLAGHCTQANASDLRILRDLDVKVAHNAVSNLFLGSGIAHVTEMHDLGITVGLGTDDANCNNSVNMLADMKTAVLAQKGRTRRADAMTAEKALEMATIDGARALGMEGEIGSIEVGKRADLTIVDLSHPRLRPLHSVASALVYQASGSEIDTVVVDGRVLLEDGTPVDGGTAGAALIASQAQLASERVADSARLSGRVRQWKGRSRHQ